MELSSIDLTAVIAVWIAGSILLVLALALAARFAVKPVLDSIARIREARVSELERRFTRLERRVERAFNTDMVRSGHSS